MITIYGQRTTRTFRAFWAAEEAGIPYQHVAIDLKKGENRTDEFLKISPMGKVPVLVDGDMALTESAAICLYLAHLAPEKKLVPIESSPEYFQCLRWMFFCMTELEEPLWTMAKSQFALPKEYRVPEISNTALYEFKRALKVLEQGVKDAHEKGHQYIAGPDFSVADILIGHTLMWATLVKIPLESENGIVKEYYKLLKTRPLAKKLMAE